eukprot:205670_1
MFSTQTIACGVIGAAFVSSIFYFNQNNQNHKNEICNKPKLPINDNANNEKIVHIPVSVVAPKDFFGDKYNIEFTIKFMYVDRAQIVHLLKAVVNYLNDNFFPVTFGILYIGKGSFCADGHDDIYNYIGNNPSNDIINKVAFQSITSFSEEEICEKGLSIGSKVHHIYKVLNNNNISCPDMLKLDNCSGPLQCSVYHAMKNEYEYSEQNLNHIMDYNHYTNYAEDKPICRYFDECHSYKRLQHNGNRLDDRCHVHIYKHPPRKRQIKLAQNTKSLIFNDAHHKNHPLYVPTDIEQELYQNNENDGYLHALLWEVIQNGFKSDLCLTETDEKDDTYSILTIVDDKMSAKRHILMGSPLDRGQMLSLILYTGCDCNYDLCSSQRSGDYAKWKWFDRILDSAITALSFSESGHFKVYSGINEVKLNKKSVGLGYFVTFVSTSWDRDVAVQFLDNAGILIEMDENFKDNSFVDCCDVSWISKFPDECEVLFTRSSSTWGEYNSSFQCNVVDENNGTQIVTLSHQINVPS